MPILYIQDSGKVYQTHSPGSPATFLGIAYAGRGDGLNNPAAQWKTGIGPLPAASYAIGPRDTTTHLGPFVWALTPAPGSDMRGRGGFFIHWDNSARNFTGSEGCIVAPPALMAALDKILADPNEHKLMVVKYPADAAGLLSGSIA
jgi:hypothetical protein